jgi:CDP-diacylglycerol--serine O-phosphatidyltransferase
MHWLGKISSADLLTLLNGLLGMMAITYILDERYVFAAMLIFMAVVVDGMDGMVARKFKKKHDFGRFLDSISDAVSFCLAPGILIYSNFYNENLGSAWESIPNAICVFASVLFVGFGLLRLARFAGKDFKIHGFLGLPTPAAALIAIVMCLLWGNPELNPFSLSYELYPVNIAVIGLAMLMVSEMPYPKIEGRVAKAAGTVLALGILVMGLYVIETELEMPYTKIFLAMLVLLCGYLVIGPIWQLTRPDYVKPEKRKMRRLARRKRD